MMTRQVRDIEYELAPGSTRRTTDVVIERNGRIVVRPPITHTPEQVDAVVESKRLWIYRNLAEWKDMNATAVAREWVNGETFLYLGSAYRLAFVSDQTSELMLRDGYFRLSREVMETGGVDAAKHAFEHFYIEKGLHRLSGRVKFYTPKVGVDAPDVRVKDMGYRWASCGAKGTVNFHWKCMMAPSKIIDYIVVHELCHFHHQDHSDAFWNEVDKILPDWRERKDWLMRNGAGLDL